jgi:hypothetical protein
MVLVLPVVLPVLVPVLDLLVPSPLSEEVLAILVHCTSTSAGSSVLPVPVSVVRHHLSEA